MAGRHFFSAQINCTPLDSQMRAIKHQTGASRVFSTGSCVRRPRQLRPVLYVAHPYGEWCRPTTNTQHLPGYWQTQFSATYLVFDMVAPSSLPIGISSCKGEGVWLVILNHLTPERLNAFTVFFLSRQHLAVSPWKLQLRFEIHVECRLLNIV